MHITVYSEDGKSYTLSIRRNQCSHTLYTNMIWLANEGGKGMECERDKISNLLYAALDDFFQKNY